MASTREDGAATSWSDFDGQIVYRLLDTPADAVAAAALELQVWREFGFGHLDEEGPYLPTSTGFGAFLDAACVGACRLFRPVGATLPVFSLPMQDPVEAARLLDHAIAGTAAEVGTYAVRPDQRGDREDPRQRVSLRLRRLLYRWAIQHSVTELMVIAEVARMGKENLGSGLHWRQLGPEAPYQNGRCAAWALDLAEVPAVMESSHPSINPWFVHESFTPPPAS